MAVILLHYYTVQPVKIKASFVNFGLCNSVKAEEKKQLDEGVSDISQVLFVTLSWCLCIWGRPLWERLS